MSAQEELRNMILSFRVSELSDLLGFASRSKTGKKQELQSRALDLLKLHSTPVQMKIHELHKRRFNSSGIMTGSSLPETMGPTKLAMGPSTSNEDPSQSMALHSPMSHPMNYRPNMNYAGPSQGKPQGMSMNIPSLAPQPKYPMHPDVQLKPLPFYDVLAVLIKPSCLIPDVGVTFQESTFEFTLSPQQANDITASKDYNNEHGTQIQLRFCLLETSCEQDDNFPPNVLVKVNAKLVSLPAAIPTNRPGVAPKRPSRPVNITPTCKLSPMQKNILTVSWAAEYSRPYCLAVHIVKRLDSKILMSRLRTKGMRNPDHTRAVIKEKLTPSPDSEIATTSLRGSLLCPIGKKKMTEPCRPLTCTHLQCFDADLFIKMNEKKPRWICPVCDKPAPFNSLAIDGLFSEISAKAPSSCNEVQFHEDGSWTPIIHEKEVKDTYNIDGTIQSSHIMSPVKKKSKKDATIEVVTLDDSDTDEEWSSSSSVAHQSQFKSSSSLDLKIPSSSSFLYGGKVNAGSHEPFISLPSPSSPYDVVEPSPVPAVLGSPPQSIGSPSFMPIPGPTPNMLKPPSSTVTSARSKDSNSELDQRYNMTETSSALQSGYPDMSYNNNINFPSYYSSVSSPPPPHDSNPQGYSETGNNDTFDLFSLLDNDVDPHASQNDNCDKSPDVISID